MSLINDALRRAKAAQPAAPPQPEVQFRPVEQVQQPRRNSRGILILIGLVILVVTFAGLIATARKLQPAISAQAQSSAPEPVKAPQPQSQSSATPIAAPAPVSQPLVSAIAPSQPASPVQQSPVVANEPPSASTSLIQQVAVPESANNGSPVEFVPTKPAPPRLQGILWSPKNPSAMINGKTVFVGDKFGDARVAAIGKDSATLVSSGETNVLTLAQ